MKLRPALTVPRRTSRPVTATHVLGLGLVALVPLAIASRLYFDTNVGGASLPPTRRMMAAAVDAYPLWVTNNPGAACPTEISAVNLGDTAIADEWGRELRFACKPDGLVVWSAGPDKTFGTADDLHASRTH